MSRRDGICKCGANGAGANGLCRPCAAEASRDWRRRNPTRSKEIHARSRRKTRPDLRSTYGTTLAFVEDLAAKQQGRCLICGIAGNLGVDHDHATGKIRGLLCGNCNRGLGMFNDDVNRLFVAALYLQSHQNYGESDEQLTLTDLGATE